MVGISVLSIVELIQILFAVLALIPKMLTGKNTPEQQKVKQQPDV